MKKQASEGFLKKPWGIRFDQERYAHCIMVKKGDTPKDIVSQLNIKPLPNGIIFISGGAKEFPLEIMDSVNRLIEFAIIPLAYEYNLMIVDGGINSGIMKLVGEKFDRAKKDEHYNLINTQNTKNTQQYRNPMLVGIVPGAKITYPGLMRSPQGYGSLDPNHTHFIIVHDAKDWGEEVDCMFSFLDYLSTNQKLPVVYIIANGGYISLREAYHALKQGQHIIVLEETHRATEAIIAVLDGVSEKDLVDLLINLDIATHEHALQEAILWLNKIAEYNRISRLSFISRPYKELRENILLRLGLDVTKLQN